MLNPCDNDNHLMGSDRHKLVGNLIAFHKVFLTVELLLEIILIYLAFTGILQVDNALVNSGERMKKWGGCDTSQIIDRSILASFLVGPKI